MTDVAQRRRRRRDVITVGGVALFMRLAVVAWAAGSIPPAADGQYYHKLAVRMAEGHGYTWLWDDGAVTYAAHYPVGYPAMIALGYVIFGVKPVVAMLINAIIGAGGAIATWSLVSRVADAAAAAAAERSRRLALFAGLAVAIHPVLVPYTAAIMTEGVTASLLVIAAAIAAHARAAERHAMRWLALMGVVLGIATLVRPQSLALAPLLGGLAIVGRAPPSLARRAAIIAGVLVTVCALAVCAPWTVRNCVRMEKCSLVSVNGGWNLAIGTQTDNGGWHEIAVPEACKTVFQEAAKDECFGREAMKVILQHPLTWLARAPAKLRATFDYFGAAPWYLHDANASRFPYGAKVALGSIETIASRLLLAAALVTIFRWPRAPRAPHDTTATRRDRARKVVALIGLLACVVVPGSIGYLALAIATCLLGWRTLTRDAPLIVPVTTVVILTTAVIHAVFFGAGRYGMVVVPFVTALAFVRMPVVVTATARTAGESG